MTIGRHQHWGVPNRLTDEFKQVLDRFFTGNDDSDQSNVVTAQWAPRVDIREDEKRFVILADVPGVDPASIEINMEKGILSIKGERRSEAKEGDGKLTRAERTQGVFYRRFTLPDSADAEGITASGRHGVLEISIPKKPETTPRRISIATQ